MVSSIRFGNERAVVREVSFSSDMQLVLFVVLLIHALYALILYFIGTRNHALLSFLMLISSTILMVLLDNNKLLLQWFPDIGYGYAAKAISLSYVGMGYFLFRTIGGLLNVRKGTRHSACIPGSVPSERCRSCCCRPTTR